jgi:hypothetical protein
LDILDVNTDAMSEKTQAYYFMSILKVYLPDELVTRFLTDADRKQLEREQKDIDWNQCYYHYCQRFGSPKMVHYAFLYNDELAGLIMVPKTAGQQNQSSVFTPECTATAQKAAKVDDQTVLAMFEVMGFYHLLQRDSDGSINEFMVRPDAQGQGQISKVNTYSAAENTMSSLVAYFESTGEKLVRVNDTELA